MKSRFYMILYDFMPYEIQLVLILSYILYIIALYRPNAVGKSLAESAAAVIPQPLVPTGRARCCEAPPPGAGSVFAADHQRSPPT